MGMKTLIEFASDKLLTQLLVKERAKCLRRNRSDQHHHLDKDCELQELSIRKQLCRLMPPRYTWVRPSKRKTLTNGAIGIRKNAEKSLLLTIKRDTVLWQQGKTYSYLEELHAYFKYIRECLTNEALRLKSPRLMPILKDTKKLEDGTLKVTCRPLSVYSKLEDKIILALTSRYLTRYFNRYLHENILSYRPARDFHGRTHHVTDFNDGVQLIQAYRETHNSENIYAADCDIKKFYDIIPHRVVSECFQRMLNESNLTEDGKQQVMRVLNAYLASYNFYANALKMSQESPDVFAKVRSRLHDKENNNTYLLGRVGDIDDEDYKHRGVPQGGALSLLVANIVLNDVDRVLVGHTDDNRLFVRYCDDMILLHTDYNECCRLMELYAQSLHEHGLFYHDFESVSQSKSSTNPNATTSHFWEIKSHSPFLWSEGENNSNLYIGFLGYEIKRNGQMRLRKSNIKRIDEKFMRLRYALRRYQKSHSEEEFLNYMQHKLDGVINSVDVYTAFNQDLFRSSAQYRHIEKKRQQEELVLRKILPPSNSPAL